MAHLTDLRDRKSHLQWCKDRALEYLNAGDVANGMASFVSDMGKHEETAKTMNNGLSNVICMNALMSNDPRKCIEAVNGFN